MKTLEEILFNHISKDVCVGFETGIVGSVKEAMKEYATEYAKEALKNASDGLVEWSYEKYPNFRTAREHIISEYNLPKH